MTRRKSKHALLVRRLKALLLTGSVMATFAGTHLLAQEDSVQQVTEAFGSESIMIVIPSNDGSTSLLPRSSPESRPQLRPIPQAIQPRFRPVARGQSSR